MQDSEDRSQRHSAIVARELARLDIDIAALSEVRFAKQGSVKEDRAGYNLLWSGKNKDERLPFWCRRHDQDFHCQKIAELANWSFSPHHAPMTLNPGQQVCHCPQCVRTYSAG